MNKREVWRKFIRILILFFRFMILLLIKNIGKGIDLWAGNNVLIYRSFIRLFDFIV